MTLAAILVSLFFFCGRLGGLFLARGEQKKYHTDADEREVVVIAAKQKKKNQPLLDIHSHIFADFFSFSRLLYRSRLVYHNYIAFFVSCCP